MLYLGLRESRDATPMALIHSVISAVLAIALLR